MPEPTPLPFPALRGRRVLVVEDEYLLAEDVCRELERLGVVLLGPVPSVWEALDILDRESTLDAAILDINLEDERVYPVADALRARGIPFVFVTGYDALTIPEAYADVPKLEKPVALREIMEALAE